MNLKNLAQTLRLRVKDLTKNIAGSRSELDALEKMTDYISEKETFKLSEQIETNTKNLVREREREKEREDGRGWRWGGGAPWMWATLLFVGPFSYPPHVPDPQPPRPHGLPPM